MCLLNDDGHRAIEGLSRPLLVNLTVPLSVLRARLVRSVWASVRQDEAIPASPANGLDRFDSLRNAVFCGDVTRHLLSNAAVGLGLRQLDQPFREPRRSQPL